MFSEEVKEAINAAETEEKVLAGWFEKHFGNFSPSTEMKIAIDTAYKELLSILGVSKEPDAVHPTTSAPTEAPAAEEAPAPAPSPEPAAPAAE